MGSGCIPCTVIERARGPPPVWHTAAWQGYKCESHAVKGTLAPKHLRKLVLGGGDECQNVPEEGGQARTGIGVGHKTSVV